MYKYLIMMFGVFLLSSFGTASHASEDRMGNNCVLEVDNKYYIEGECPYSDNNEYSSRTIIVGSNEHKTLPFFAYLLVEDETTAIGYWNGSPQNSHAHAELGILTKSGKCWIGDRARVCYDPQPVGYFSHAGWVGGATGGSHSCAMAQRFSDGQAEIVVETISTDDISLGIRWLNGANGDVGKSIDGIMNFDKAPPLRVTGSFVEKNYLKFESNRFGLLRYLFSSSSRLRAEYGTRGWFTLDLRGSFKALQLLFRCRASAQEAQSPHEGDRAVAEETFRISDRGIFRPSYGAWINIGDEYSRDRIAKFLSGLNVSYQFTYGEDCVECVNVSSGDIQLYFDSGDGKTIQSIQVMGGAFTTERGDQIGDIISRNGTKLYCSDGMYEVCARYEQDNVGLIVDRSKCISDGFKEGLKQPSGNFLRDFGQCERIDAFLLQKPDSGATDTDTQSSGD